MLSSSSNEYERLLLESAMDLIKIQKEEIDKSKQHIQRLIEIIIKENNKKVDK